MILTLILVCHSKESALKAAFDTRVLYIFKWLSKTSANTFTCTLKIKFDHCNLSCKYVCIFLALRTFNGSNMFLILLSHFEQELEREIADFC